MPCSDGKWYEEQANIANRARLNRYVRQFCKLLSILSDDQIIELLNNDKEFAETFNEHQLVDQEAGRPFIVTIVDEKTRKTVVAIKRGFTLD